MGYTKVMGARERILDYVRSAGKPVSSHNLSEGLGLPRNTVYYNTTVLVAAEKIKRYMGLAGVFVLAEEN